MTNQREDNRPLPPEIYMRRRVAALVGILVVVALIVWGLTAIARSGSSEEPTETSTENTAENAGSTSTEQITAEPTVPVPGEETTKQKKPAETETQSATEPEAAAKADASGECSVKDLLITASTSKPSYSTGEKPDFYMEVENPTDKPCAIDLGKGQLRFEVYGMADNQRIWSDTDCFPPVIGGEQVFEPKASRSFEARWSATGSKPGQCTNREPVAAGSYYLHAVINDTASNPVDFTLR